MADSWVPVVVGIVAAVFGFIGVIIGGIVTGSFTVRAERARADKTEAVDNARRRDDRLLDRDNFQRATLLGLQDMAGELVTFAAQVHTHDSSSFAKTGKWPTGRARPSPAHLNARLTLRKLQSRVIDEEVRGLVEGMLASDAAVSAASDPESARRALADTQASERRLIARSGELILQAFRADDRPPS